MGHGGENMSVGGYFGRREKELEIQKDDPILDSDGKVLGGSMSGELRARLEAMKDKRRGERYRNVGCYDPVLRGHCRLDSEG